MLPSGMVAVAVNSPSLFVTKLCHTLALPEDKKDAWTRVRVVDPVTGVGAWIDQYRYHYNQSLRIADPTTFVAKPVDIRSQVVPPRIGGPHAVQRILGANAVPLDNGPTGRVRAVGRQSATTVTRGVHHAQALATTQTIPAMGSTWIQPAMSHFAVSLPAATQPAMTLPTMTLTTTAMNAPFAPVAPMIPNTATANAGVPGVTNPPGEAQVFHSTAGSPGHCHAYGQTMPTSMTTAPNVATSTGDYRIMGSYAPDFLYLSPQTVATHNNFDTPIPYNRMNLGNPRSLMGNVYDPAFSGVLQENATDGYLLELSAPQENEENLDNEVNTDHETDTATGMGGLLGPQGW
jgi:hypothetical protein